MGSKNPKIRQGSAMTDVPAMTLVQYCPDLQAWPERWMFDETDMATGQDIVEFFKPFLLTLLGGSLSIKTLHRHRDHLWLLGGELIRKRYDDPKLKRMSADQAVTLLIEEDGGPLIWPRITETEQNSFDATCRKLYKYLNSGKKTV